MLITHRSTKTNFRRLCFVINFMDNKDAHDILNIFSTTDESHCLRYDIPYPDHLRLVTPTSNTLLWPNSLISLSDWQHSLRRGTAAARLLGLRVRILPGHGYPCRQVQLPATGRSLVQRSPTECNVSLCDFETPEMGKLGPTRSVEQ